MLKTFKFKLNPNKKQIEFFEKCFGCVRYIYNWGLDLRIKKYNSTKKDIGWTKVCKELTQLKKVDDYKWLCEVPAQSLQSAIRNMDSAFLNFYKKKCKFPKFKTKKGKQSFHVIDISINFNTHKIKIPKIGWVNFYRNRNFNGQIKSATISKSKTNNYYISILVEDGKLFPTVSTIKMISTVGIDVGIKDFAILSNGQIYTNPKYLEKAEERLKYLQRKYSKKHKGSKDKNVPD